MRLCTVLNYRNARFFRNGKNSVHVRRASEKMHDDDCFYERVFFQQFLQGIGGHCIGFGANIGKNRFRSRSLNSGDGGDSRVGDGCHMISVSDAHSPQNQLDCIRSIGTADTLFCSAKGGKSGLESVHFLSQDVPSAV